MSRGSYTMKVPHICGELILVRCDWTYHPGTYEDPPDWDTSFIYLNEEEEEIHNCTKCGISLYDDTLFERNVEAADVEQVDRGEEMYEPDYEPDLEEPEMYWDDR
jgi:hypothetical protein